MYGLDFVNDLDPAEALLGSTWTLDVVAGEDDDPTSHLQGVSFVIVPDGSTVKTATIQRIGGLLPGVTYTARAVVTTDLGNTKSLWAHIRGEEVL